MAHVTLYDPQTGLPWDCPEAAVDAWKAKGFTQTPKTAAAPAANKSAAKKATAKRTAKKAASSSAAPAADTSQEG